MPCCDWVGTGRFVVERVFSDSSRNINSCGHTKMKANEWYTADMAYPSSPSLARRRGLLRQESTAQAAYTCMRPMSSTPAMLVQLWLTPVVFKRCDKRVKECNHSMGKLYTKKNIPSSAEILQAVDQAYQPCLQKIHVQTRIAEMPPLHFKSHHKTSALAL